MRQTHAILTLICLLLALPGCKRKVIDTGNSVSPRGGSVTPSPTTTTTTQTSPTVAHQEALRVLGPIDEPDAKVRRARPASPAGKADAMSDEQKAALARAATEKAVSAAIGVRAGQLQRCYESTSTQAASVKVKLRVHRRGYVLDTTITGCNDRARACMAGVLQQMQVSGMQTDSVTVERTFNFRARTVIKHVK